MTNTTPITADNRNGMRPEKSRLQHLVVIFACLAAPHLTRAQTAYWQDNFDSYTAGQSVPAPWFASGGPNVITTSQSYASTQSLELDGAVGGCWSAICYRQIPVTNALYLEFAVCPSGDHDEGCHPWVGLIGITTTPDWTTAQGRWFVTLEYSGQSILGGYPGQPGTSVLSTWSYDQWLPIGLLYQKSPNNICVTYFINGTTFGPYNFVPCSYENSLQYIAFDSGDGATWIDDVLVGPPSMTPRTLTLTVVNDQLALSLFGASGVSYMLQSSTNLVNWSNVATLVPVGGLVQTNLPINGHATFFRTVLKQ